MITKSAGKLLLKLGKKGVRRLLTEPLLQRAATATQLEFERIEIRDTLVKWSQSEDLVELLEELKDGKRHDVGSLVPAFLENTEFFAGEETEQTAQVSGRNKKSRNNGGGSNNRTPRPDSFR